mmetsp:Transcript_144035/g.375073  ORF Transcript_144035/g.375073 Transcript_144035/m.375073 type:complete len:330 (+) Transcript_144035:1138-2127(+)
MPPCVAELENIAEQEALARCDGLVLRELGHLLEDGVELGSVGVLSCQVEGWRSHCEEGRQGLESLAAGGPRAEQVAGAVHEEPRAEHAAGDELAYKFDIPEGALLSHQLGLLVGEAAGRRGVVAAVGRGRGTGLEEAFEGALAPVEQQPSEAIRRAPLRLRGARQDAGVGLEAHAEVGVHGDEVVLHGGLLEDLLHEALDVAHGPDAACGKLLIQAVELLDGQLVQDGPGCPHNLRVVRLAGTSLATLHRLRRVTLRGPGRWRGARRGARRGRGGGRRRGRLSCGARRRDEIREVGRIAHCVAEHGGGTARSRRLLADRSGPQAEQHGD